ncbi:12357_t:CDS:2, partial [Funneliformis caledonium]
AYQKPLQIRVKKLLYSLAFINPKILGPNSEFITSSIIKAAKESNFSKEPVKTQFDSIAPLVLSPTLTLIDIMTREDKSNNQQGRSKPPNQGHRSGYGLENNKALDKSGIAAIIRQMSDSFKEIAKEIRDARPQAFPRETNIIPV